VSHATLQKSIAAALRKGAAGDGTPGDDQIKLINGLTLRDFEAKELYVREFIIAHNAIDRDGEVIDEALLERFVKTLPGKGMFIKHPMGWDGDTGPGEAVWFAARTELMSLASARDLLREPELKLPHDRTQAMVLFASMYMHRHASNEALISKIDAGVAKFVSLGFGASGRADVINPATKMREAVRLLGPGDAYEASLVWLGAQPGARAHKNAKDTSMSDVNEIQTKLTKAEGEVTTLKAENATLKAAGTVLDALKAALGDQAVMLENPAQLAAQVKAGKEFTDALVADLIKADRLAKRVGDTEADVKSATAMYAAMPLATLKHLHSALASSLGGGAATVTPGDPGAGKVPLPNNEKDAVPAALDFLK
jgi:hypothetical protein